jgi:hypothetical protein
VLIRVHLARVSTRTMHVPRQSQELTAISSNLLIVFNVLQVIILQITVSLIAQVVLLVLTKDFLDKHLALLVHLESTPVQV